VGGLGRSSPPIARQAEGERSLGRSPGGVDRGEGSGVNDTRVHSLPLPGHTIGIDYVGISNLLTFFEFYRVLEAFSGEHLAAERCGPGDGRRHRP
jgi:hypothetical protein